MWQPKRSYQPEILDLGSYTPDEYDSCLKLLCRVNRLLGGFKATKRAFHALKSAPTSILEVGCGGGYLCQQLHRLFPQASIKGIDLSSAAISHADKELPIGLRDKVSFSLQDSKNLDFKQGSFDVVTTMLVCHHMTDEELVQFLQEAYHISSKAVVINDLQRHFLAYWSFSLIAPFLFRNRLIWNDGRISVRRAFRKSDWKRLMERAGFHESQWKLTWNWAFRWTLTLRKS
jgi:2-polyprenyl-3-methyl-5-hydroxy-6-metoxy-1,4-benzoquinol methylase